MIIVLIINIKVISSSNSSKSIGVLFTFNSYFIISYIIKFYKLSL